MEEETFGVTSLGSCIMTQVATGIGALQRPLRDIYVSQLARGTGQIPQYKTLYISPAGISIYSEDPSGRTEKNAYKMASISFWDAVQFVTVRNLKDKKHPVKSAFEPLDNDHSRNKGNLFVPLHKDHYFLLERRHAPLFTCVLRRTEGVKALYVHAFICQSDNQALEIVKALNDAQKAYKNGEANETGVFDYKPFQSGMGRSQSVKSLNNVGLSLSPGPAVSIDIGGESNSAERSSRPAPFILPSPKPVLSQSQQHQPQQRMQRKSEGDHQVLNLTQADFGPAAQSPLKNVIKSKSEDELSRSPARQSLTTSQSGYEVDKPPKLPIKHLRDNLQPVSKQKTDNVGHSSLGSRALTSSVAPSVTPQTSESGTSSDAFERPVSVAERSRQFMVSAPPQKSSNRGKSKSYHVRGAHDRLSDLERKHNNRYKAEVITGEPDLPPHYQNARQPTINSHLDNSTGGSGGHGDDTAPSLPPRRTQSTRQPINSYHQDRASSHIDLRENRQRQPFETRGGIANLPVRTPDTPGSNGESVFTKPVAKVPPHKVSGVGVKVLPEPELPAKTKRGKSESNTQSIGRDMGTTKHFNGVAPRRSKSQYFNGKQSPPNGNWQFKQSQRVEKDASLMNRGSGGYVPGGDKLLLGQKKEAEIASVLHEMRFNVDDRTMSPGMPAGNNFEKSLGYFP